MPERVHPGKAESQMTLASRTETPDDKSSSWWSERSPVERRLILVTAVALLIALVLAVTLAVVATRTRRLEKVFGSTGGVGLKGDVCLTKGCINAANDILTYMNSSVDPCDNFYEFACGGYLGSTTIPDDKTSMSQFTIIGDRLKQQLRLLIEQDVREDEPEHFKKVKNLYKACLNKTRIEELGLQEMHRYLDQLGGWPVLEGQQWQEEEFEWHKSVYDFRKVGYSIDYFIDFSVAVDLKNSTKRTIDIDQPSLGMSREYLVKGMNESEVKAYYNYMVGIAVLLGADKERAEKELTESLLFEITLANYSLPREERRDANKLYNPMSVREMETRFPFLNWLEYMNTLLPEKVRATVDEVVIVNVPSYLSNFSRIIKETPKRVMANYVMWRVVQNSVSYLTEDARDLQLKYLAKLTGRKERKPRWEECMNSVTGSLGNSVGALYVRSYFDEEAKSSALEMVKYIRETYDNILREVDWMDEVTRQRALEKSKAITPHIGYPDELLKDQKLNDLYNGLEISPDFYLRNGRSMSIFGTNYAFNKLREPVDKHDWVNHGDAAVVNAYYSPLENSIQFPAGILQGVFFDKDRPRYLNYGAIGFVIGHEITHGFDDQGRQFDKDGNLNEWWEPETKQQFKNKTQCVIWQYGNYTVEEVGLNLNGINTQGENVADNGGLKEAYRAYEEWVSKNGEEPLVAAYGLSQRQLFWMSAANVWCSLYRPESLKLRILTGYHSPAEFRVNGPLSNIPHFGRDFNCPVGSKMRPRQTCTVW